MRSRVRPAARLLLAILVLGAPPMTAAAHDGQGARLEITGLVRPGGLLEVTGADFSAGATVDIGLSSGLGTRQLSSVTAASDGHFFDALRVPDDIGGGVWEVRARDTQGVGAVARLVVDAPLGEAPPASSSAVSVDLVGMVAGSVALVRAAAAIGVALYLVRRGTSEAGR